MSHGEIPRHRTQAPEPDLLAARLRLLRAAACYTELAGLSGTWNAAGIEAAIENKGVSTKREERAAQGTHKYRRYRDGAPPRLETLEIVEQKYPKTSLRYWTYHPVGVLLLSPELSQKQIVDAIEHLPDGEARRMMWAARGKTRVEIPDSEELIDELVSLQSVDGLVVILGRLRLRMLLGQTDDIDLYEHGVLDCFPEVVGRNAHLSVARHPLMQALSDFLCWQCNWAGPHEALDATGGASVRTGDFWPLLWSRLEKAASNTQLAQRPDLKQLARVRSQNNTLEQRSI